MRVNVYSYGRPGNTASDLFGTLRFGRFRIEQVVGGIATIDSNDQWIWHGDSGSVMLVPNHASPGVHDDYRIAAVVISREPDLLFADLQGYGLTSDEFGSWFDGVLGRDAAEIVVAIGGF
jgi:hypothetical protein